MEEAEKIIGKVNSNERKERYGNTEGVTANALYKKYTDWFKNKYKEEASPLTYKEWLIWAIKNKLVDKPKDETKEVTTDLSANKLYKKYILWYIKKYDSTKGSLSFSKWLGVAKKKGIVEKDIKDPGEFKAFAEGKEKLISGKVIAGTLLVISLIFLTIGLIKSKK